MPRTTKPSRFAAFREAADDDKKKKRKKPKTVAEVVTDIEDTAIEVPALASQLGLTSDMVALRIDANLESSVWNGTKFDDRMSHMVKTMREELVGSVENSLMQQERWEDFRDRMYKELGIESDEPAGALAKFERQIESEAKLAWNEAMLEANMDAEDSTEVWRSMLLSTTTPGCAAKHGRMIVEELGGQVPLAHYGCHCDVISVPNPNSLNRDIAAQGRAIIDEMRAEREAWGASDADVMEESRPSRFRAFREGFAEVQ